MLNKQELSNEIIIISLIKIHYTFDSIGEN